MPSPPIADLDVDITVVDSSSDPIVSRLDDLRVRLHGLGSVVVAFSGGADSAFLLAAAIRALGADRVVAATAVSSSLPQAELAAARAFAADLGVRHEMPSTHEMEREGYRANTGARCYFCKAELVEVLLPLLPVLGIRAVATGTNADDARAGFRPGIRAAAERGAVTPLLDAGLTKEQVRAASRARGLATWDKPAAACLSSRVAYGIEVTPTRLARVERAEVALRGLLSKRQVGFDNVRVRDLGQEARVELDSQVASRVLSSSQLVAAVVEVVETAGFSTVVVDPDGFRSGSMNELLAEPERFR